MSSSSLLGQLLRPLVRHFACPARCFHPRCSHRLSLDVAKWKSHIAGFNKLAASPTSAARTALARTPRASAAWSLALALRHRVLRIALGDCGRWPPSATLRKRSRSALTSSSRCTC
eukprot:6209288-Pleurochrysis_carterae.AAC.4